MSDASALLVVFVCNHCPYVQNIESAFDRGAFDESTPGNNKPVTGASLRAAFDLVLAGKPVPLPHRPAVGCSIKWRPGNEPR